MSGLFNRLKTRKGGPHPTNNNEHESVPPTSAFDEEGFLCPICHQKFNDHTTLAQHYTEAHTDTPSSDKEDSYNQKNTVKKEDTSTGDVNVWKQKLATSERNRGLLTSELTQQKQRADNLEDELNLLRKHLKLAQTKIAEQSLEITNLKATQEVYSTQFASVTNELIHTKAELKEKQQQVNVLYNDLIPRPTSDDVDVLKRELVTVQQRMDALSLEKEQEIKKLRSVLAENYQYTKRLDQLENKFNQNLSICDKLVKENTPYIDIGINEIKQFIKTIRERTEKFHYAINNVRNSLNEKQRDIEQLKKINDNLVNDLQLEQKQTNTCRNRIESLTNEIQVFEKTLNELKNEKYQLIQSKMNGDENDERQNLVRQITQEKDQCEKQIKELRGQIKEITSERQQIQYEFDQISKQNSQLLNEKNQLQNEQIQLNHEIESLQKRLEDANKDKKRQMNELTTLHEQYKSMEQNFQKVNEQYKSQKLGFDQIKTDLTEIIQRLETEKSDLKQTIDQYEKSTNDIKIQLSTIEKENHNLGQELKNKQQTIETYKTTLTQLNIDLSEKDIHIQRLSTTVRRTTNLAHKIYQCLQEKVHTTQRNILATIDEAKQNSISIRAQTLEQIREEFTHYLTIVHRTITDNKIESKKQIELENAKFIELQQQTKQELTKLKQEYDQLMQEHQEQKRKYETKVTEMKNNLFQTSESLSIATQAVDLQRDRFTKQINSLEAELQSRTKKQEMQLAALTENLATLRVEIKSANEKLATLEQIKSQKAEIESRLAVSQDERRTLLERSLASESKNEKLILENGQLAKKIAELDAASKELSREFQALQFQHDKLTQRRWLKDEDVHACMKCHESFSVTQRKHHCRNCGRIFCDDCSSKTAIVAASSKKPQRVCQECYNDLTS